MSDSDVLHIKAMLCAVIALLITDELCSAIVGMVALVYGWKSIMAARNEE